MSENEKEAPQAPANLSAEDVTETDRPSQELTLSTAESEPETQGTGEEKPSIDIDRVVAGMTRRGFVTGAIAAGVGFGAWKWLRNQPREGGLQRPFRRVLEMNEKISMSLFSLDRLSPQFRRSDLTLARVNGRIGLTENYQPESWRLRIEGMAGLTTPVTLTLNDIMSFPAQEMITELRCIEGWSIIVQWTGTRLADLMAKYPPPTRDGSLPDVMRRPERLVRYVSMETPGRGYYVGLDMASALHPQTLLAYAINGNPLPWQHGAPLRLAIPVKYGIKNIKRIGTIRYSDSRPADFWGSQGYDWYSGH